MIVITGATGHLGNVLVRKLVNQNKKVRALILPGEDIASLEGLEVEKRRSRYSVSLRGGNFYPSGPAGTAISG
jgi:uncharacterized protein YbjT (DUF2867 family)